MARGHRQFPAGAPARRWNHPAQPPDLVAVAGAVLAAAGFAVVPANRALRLLGRTARLAEFGYHARRADDLIHRLGLPEEWSHWRC
jgi:hypothetical protein